MDVKCCECKKEYDLRDNIFGYDKANCPILICPHCGFKHLINFMPFEKRIKVKKIEKLDLTVLYVNLGASRIATASRVDQSGVDDNPVSSQLGDILGMGYDNKYKYVSEQDVEPADVTFDPDGTKMYIVGYDSQTVYQYILTTPWDVSTASYSGKSTYVGSQETQPLGIAFSTDGTKMYIVGYTNDTVYQYSLTTPWDVDTSSYTGKSFDVSIQDTAPIGIAFNTDGTKMYIVGSKNTVYQYNLTTPWDVPTAYRSDSANVSIEGTSRTDVTFNSDGTKMFVVGQSNNKVSQYNLTTPWDVSTASYAKKSFDVSSQDTAPIGIAFNTDSSKMYLMGNHTNTVYQYIFSPVWNKTNDFILATRIYTSKGPIARAYKLRWRDVTDEGVFVDVGETGEISFNADTVLVDGQSLLVANKICGVQSGYAWQNGMESEGDNLLPDSGTYSLANEYYTEFQWALDCSNAEDEHEYEFELWDVTEGVSIGTCLARITMAVTIVGGLSMKWNGRTISKWNGVVINKLNGVD